MELITHKRHFEARVADFWVTDTRGFKNGCQVEEVKAVRMDEEISMTIRSLVFGISITQDLKYIKEPLSFILSLLVKVYERRLEKKREREEIPQTGREQILANTLIELS